MINHMNNDHVEAMVAYCHDADIPLPEGILPKMAGIDSEGMHLLLGRKIVRIPFPVSVHSPMKVRQQLMAMAKRSSGNGRN